MTYQTKIISGGKVALPAALRREHGLRDGDAIVVESDDTGIHIRTYGEVLKDVQRWAKSLRTDDRSIVDELIAERRTEAARE